ncbi:chemokine XC receptor 1-like [Tachysurus ichikawai]
MSRFSQEKQEDGKDVSLSYDIVYDVFDDLNAPIVHAHDSSLFVDELLNRSMADDRNIAIQIILSTVILVGLIGNLLVVVISVFFMRLRSLTAIFILNLALSDLLSVVEPEHQCNSNVWGYRDSTCKDASFARPVGYYSSVLFLVLMSVQCYMTVVHPVSVWKKGVCVTIITWMVSVYAALPNLLLVIEQLHSNGCMYIFTDALVVINTFRQNIVFVFAFLFMAFCYIKILRTILKSPTNQNHRHRATGLAFFLVVTFFICWAPYNIVSFMHTVRYFSSFNLYELHFHYAFDIFRLLAFSRCCVNPVIWFIGSKIP